MPSAAAVGRGASPSLSLSPVDVADLQKCLLRIRLIDLVGSFIWISRRELCWPQSCPIDLAALSEFDDNEKYATTTSLIGFYFSPQEGDGQN